MRVPLPGRSRRLEIQQSMSDDEIRTTPMWRAAMKRARKEREWSQTELGEIVGLKQVAISHIENGRIGRSSAVPAISVALDIPLPTPRLGEHEEMWLKFGRHLKKTNPKLFEAQVAMYKSLLGDELGDDDDVQPDDAATDKTAEPGDPDR